MSARPEEDMAGQPGPALGHAMSHTGADEKAAAKDSAAIADDRSGDEKQDKPKGEESDVEYDTKEKQYGVEKIRAITSAWSYKALIVMYIIIYITSYTHSMQQQLSRNLTPYVTSEFQRHGLTATTGIVSGLMYGVTQLPLAKILNIFGRMEGYLLCHILCSVGLIMMALCRNVETYAAAQVFWTVGSGGIGYIHTVLISDFTSLRNRMIIFALNSTAYIGNAFAGPIVAELFYEHSTFRWAFGSFAIIFPFFGALICIMLWYNLNQAKKQGIELVSPVSVRTWKESCRYYFEEFDVIGMFLLATGFSLFLLPFSLVSYAPNGWKTGYIIAMIILGPLLLATFGFWEKKYASVPLVPWVNLKDRTIIGACGVAGALFLSFNAWDSFFSSYLQVVHQRSISQARFILNIYTIASCTWGPIVGVLIRQTNHYKWIAVAAVPVAALSTGLLIHFRQPDSYIGYIIMCQILKSVSAGTIIICEQLAVMSVVSHNEVTVMLALIGLASSVGRAVGSAISGGIWTNQMPGKIAHYLPESAKANATTIYGDLRVQLSYEWGSEIREAIVTAYGDVQRNMVIAGAALMPIAFACVLLWRNVNVAKFKQTEGKIF
ncbi:MFS siderochrome iron transporter 1 like protein [Verticillium longisporum]|uniref:MFS siderochrome iron transporter 1 like protein n=1 Tax=Verticillium longisporum TaxID=100787 RepID=A0A0G4M5T8_VERLO|nr:MFS siderochrome iron transporter 1 like protein [Verticillium longisporum]CRK29547.1 hypothetical protein BN1708_004993 [Verticillium longisporum]